MEHSALASETGGRARRDIWICGSSKRLETEQKGAEKIF
jgi:hypothetical protein